ncbi:hypothetical protein NLI96_g1704 [Meripilus lineatus]|uniref:Protein kinase domain-containing protein n=1 Tax=Meripilus lineatus TaxID=2056292 RepID=A0AAD5V9M5_9APHY|nr:hypothetical protein NLI96_g1704 [Physisporinus lineatus]
MRSHSVPIGVPKTRDSRDGPQVQHPNNRPPIVDVDTSQDPRRLARRRLTEEILEQDEPVSPVLRDALLNEDEQWVVALREGPEKNYVFVRSPPDVVEADVYCGEYQGKKVALKRLRIFQMIEPSRKGALKRAFYRESLIWQGLNHECVLPFYGISEDVFEGALCMVSPWSETGNVREFLKEVREGGSIVGQDYLDMIHPWLLQVAMGLQYLHGIDLSHGDVRGPNVLVGEDGKVRLSDFGLAAISEEGGSYFSCQGGPWGWIAPELIDPEAFNLNSSVPTRASDVYSFGCLCVEFYTGTSPFAGMSQGQTLGKILKGVKPERPTYPGGRMEDNVWTTISQCWKRDWRERPSIDKVVEFFWTIQPVSPHSHLVA